MRRVIVLFLALLLCGSIVTGAAAQQRSAYSIAEAVQLALERNPAVVAAAANVRVNEARVLSARASFEPTVTVSGSTGANVLRTTSDSLTGSVSAGVTHLVYDGGIREAQFRQAQAQAESARLALAVARNDVALNTVQTYMALVVGEQLIRVREQTAAQVRTQLQQARAAFAAGTVPRADVLRAESQLATAEFDLLDAQTQTEVRRTNLRTLLVVDPASPIGVSFPASIPLVDVSAEEAARRADERPEARRAQADVRASEASLATAMLQGAVTATVNGSYVFVTTSSIIVAGLTASVTLTLPIYEGGRNAAAVELARGTLDNQRALLEQVRLTLRQEAINARFQNATANARLEAAERAASAAREALRVSEGRFAAGVSTILEITTARTEAVQAEQTLLQVAADRYTTAIVLRRALGMAPMP